MDMTSEMDAAPADAWARAMGALREINGPPPDQGTNLEILPEMTPRLGVKPVRGGVRDAPIVIHERKPGGCPEGIACSCGPVNVAKFHEDWRGTRSKGISQQPKLKARGDLRTTDGSTGTALGSKLVDDPELTLPPLQLDPLPVQATTYSFPIDSARPTVATDPHALCRADQSKLHTRAIRAEYKLVKAEAEIARLKAELAAQAQPKPARKARGKGK
jgi:hypothetical protein